MNPKAVRYSLIVGVAIVWSLIFYKVFAALDEENSLPELGHTDISHSVQTIERDTFSLWANYPDPFIPLGSEEEMKGDTAAILINNTPAVPPTSIVQSAPPVDLSFIRYLGMIANPENKSKAAIVSLRGREMLLKEHQDVDDILIKKISAEKVIILYKNKKYEINKTN